MNIDIHISSGSFDAHKQIESGLVIDKWEACDLIDRIETVIREFINEKDEDMQEGRRVRLS